MSRLRRARMILALHGILASTAPTVHAEDVVTADALFREGTAKRRANQLVEACALFQESHRLDPAGGTTFALADCLEAQGKLAQAAARYREAGAIARQRRNGEKERLVAERLAALEPRLPALTVNVSSAWRKLPGLVVTRDDQEMGPPSYGLAVPVDPGPHVVRFAADGVVPFTITVRVEERARTVVDPEAPTPLPTTPVRPDHGSPSPSVLTAASGEPPRPSPAPTSRSRLILASSLGAVGVAATAISIGSFVSSRRKVDEAAPFCPDGCDARGHALYEEARSRHFVGLAFAASAGALLTGAGLLAFTDLGKRAPTLTLSPERLSLGYEGRF